jgi:hypothetical protein
VHKRGIIESLTATNNKQELSTMNKAKLIELLLDGAYKQGEHLYHPSFKKGFKKLGFSNVSWDAVERAFWGTGRLIQGADGITRLTQSN